MRGQCQAGVAPSQAVTSATSLEVAKSNFVGFVARQQHLKSAQSQASHACAARALILKHYRQCLAFVDMAIDTKALSVAHLHLPTSAVDDEDELRLLQLASYFVCNLCFASFSSKGALHTHAFRKHGYRDPMRQFVSDAACPRCRAQLQTISLLMPLDADRHCRSLGLRQ